jgi:hypothetical protein
MKPHNNQDNLTAVEIIVVDPYQEPVESKTFGRIRILKISVRIQIWKAPDPK